MCYLYSLLEPNIQTAILIAAMAFACEFVDSSLGMGYGTALTPLLLLMGFQPLQVVPCVLLSEFVTGTMAGGFHHAVGNARFDAKLGNRDSKVMAILATTGIVGVIVAAVIAVRVSKQFLNTYIAIMVICMGLVMWLRRNKQHRFSWWGVMGVGLVSAFNKGMSGGGYGPIVTGGQILTGVRAATAIAVTSLSEGLVCLVGVIAYWAGLKGSGLIDWRLALPLVIGAVLSTPLTALTTKALDVKLNLKSLVSVVVLVLGCVTLYKAWGPMVAGSAAGALSVFALLNWLLHARQTASPQPRQAENPD